MSVSSRQFEDAFKTHYKLLCNLAHSIVRDRDASEDIVQDTFVNVWNKKEEINPDLNFRGYLLKSVSNAAINYLENNKKFISQPNSEKILLVDSAETTAPDELKIKIRQALDKLPAKCKAIFVMSRFYNMKYREIAENLDISIKTVENQMGIALEKMRDDLKPYLTREFISVAIGTGLTFLLKFLSIFIFTLYSYFQFFNQF